MQKCQNCSNSFTWKSIIKSSFRGYKPIKCSSCNSEHSVSFMTRFLYSCFLFAPSILLLTKLVDINKIFGKYDLLAYLLWIALITCIEPFFARYNIEDIERKDIDG